MTKKTLIILILVVLSIGKINSHDSIKIALSNPSISTIITFQNLLEKNYLGNKNIEFVCICYNNSDYDYSKSKEFVKTDSLRNFSFIDINDELSKDSLYQKNNCSNDFEEIFKKTNGIIFSGGDDLPPYTYGEETLLTTIQTNPGRHYFELSFLYHLIGGYQESTINPLLEKKPNYVVLGICLGMQSMSTAAGGTMIQDIPSEIYNKTTYEEVVEQKADEIHRNPFYRIYAEDDIISCSFHPVILNHQYSLIFKNNPKVLSCHHQAVDSLGKDYKVWAWSVDKKVVEAVYHSKYPNVFGVQFHPEARVLFYKSEFKLEHESDFTSIEKIFNENDIKFHIDFWRFFGDRFKM